MSSVASNAHTDSCYTATRASGKDHTRTAVHGCAATKAQRAQRAYRAKQCGTPPRQDHRPD